jgi:hypothetical protein
MAGVSETPGPVPMSKQLAQRIGPVRLRVEVARLAQRVSDLEEEVREARRDQHRLAELTDIVTELLVPLSRRDDAAVDALLAKYTDQLG